MKNLILSFFLSLFLLGCQESSSGKKFNVTGTIKNSTAKMVYLEKVPAATMEATVIDSAVLGKDGSFSLKADASESVVFNIRLDKSQYPVASVINDVDNVKLKIELSQGNNEFAEKYDVEGSPASQRMKDFMFGFNNDLQKIFLLLQETDSLKKAGTSDSLLYPRMAEHDELTRKVKAFTMQQIQQSNDPALLLFEVGYYQSTANGSGFGLPPIDNTEINSIIADASQKFPAHQSLAAVKAGLLKEIEDSRPFSWVGKEAPDFTLPDPNGNPVSLSSFRGKFVLVDFWASWCGPCRHENPNLVNAYNLLKDKNFTILGVSLDKEGDKSKWVKAIMEDKLTWTQVSELKWWQSGVVGLYRFNSIPFNVLVDPTGKVIAQNLAGGGLEFKLREVLK